MRSATARRVKGFEHEIAIRGHRLTAHEPADAGGGDAGPRPTELLAASLASCAAITMEMYADRKGWELGELEVAVDYAGPEEGNEPSFDVRIRLPADLTDEQRDRLLVIATKCPVHKTLKAQDVRVNDELELFGG
ncbi:MAG: OsmC family protein [Solirubrobacterales bacterium]